jgi:hypothetical protein
MEKARELARTGMRINIEESNCPFQYGVPEQLANDEPVPPLMPIGTDRVLQGSVVGSAGGLEGLDGGAEAVPVSPT